MTVIDSDQPRRTWVSFKTTDELIPGPDVDELTPGPGREDHEECNKDGDDLGGHSTETEGCRDSSTTGRSTVEGESRISSMKGNSTDKSSLLLSPAMLGLPEKNEGVLRFSDLRKTLRKEIAELMSFRDCEELLRATNLSVVVHRGSSIFSSAGGNEQTYSLSKVTKDIDVFLSHNWTTPRRDKFLTLVYEYNYNMAVSVMLVASLILFALMATSVIPMVPDKTIEDRFPPYTGWACKVFSVPIYLLTMCFGREIRSAAGSPGPSLFLDKCCIDQVDREVQRRGIRKLGAFLSKSRRMLVLYSDVYLRKLWTIYEMASFLAIHNLKDLKIVPVVQPRIFFACLGFWWFYNITVVALRISQSFYHYMYATSLLGGYLCMLGLRVWIREKAAIETRVRHFTVEESLCANEADRPLVYHNIMCLMQGARLAEAGCPMEDALRAFNDLVRNTLPYAFVALDGFRAFPMRDYLLLGFAFDGVKALDWGATLWSEGWSFRFIFSESMYHVVWAGTWPIALVTLEFLGSYKVELLGCREKAYVGICVILVALVLAIFNQIILIIGDRARESDLFLLVLILVIILVWALFFVLCRDRRRYIPPDANPRCSTSSTSSASSDDGTRSIHLAPNEANLRNFAGLSDERIINIELDLQEEVLLAKDEGLVVVTGGYWTRL